jgi:hypothetical protein
MERRKKYLKVLAFVPAVVLVGAFVGCRGGAFQMFSKPEQKAEPPASESKPTYTPGTKSFAPVPFIAPAGEQNTAAPAPNAPQP